MERVSIPLGASTLTVESGKLAKQANGSAYVRYGDTVVLATACSADSYVPDRFSSPSRWAAERLIAVVSGGMPATT